MTDYLELTVDKFIFKVATDRMYTAEGLWIKDAGSIVRMGVSDYFQQHNGDITFVNPKPVGSELKTGDECISIETIKVDISLASPISGNIQKINDKIIAKPEIINEDPYAEGWICEMTSKDGNEGNKNLISPDQYFALIKKEAEEELK